MGSTAATVELNAASEAHNNAAGPDAVRADLEPYLRRVDESADGGPGPLVRQWVDQHITRRYAGLTGDDRPRMVDFLVAVNTALQADIAYTVRLEPGVQTPDTTLANALGSCRDSAWVLVSVLREAGLAARFVSGYLVQLRSDVEALDGPSGPAEDFTDLHAWAEVFVPGAGWIGLDPTSGLFAGEGHIPLSATPHPSSAAPITGSTAPVAVTMSFSNTVRRVHEDPRVTKPYTETQWAAVDALGQRVDELLTAGDVRLTMGGEPTFVSADDTATPQWEGAADGPEKRALAQQLAARLEQRWAAGGVVHHGQGGAHAVLAAFALDVAQQLVQALFHPQLAFDQVNPAGLADEHVIAVALVGFFDRDPVERRRGKAQQLAKLHGETRHQIPQHGCEPRFTQTTQHRQERIHVLIGSGQAERCHCRVTFAGA